MQFFVGETSRAPALLLAFATEKIKNLLLALYAHEQFELNFIGILVYMHMWTNKTTH